MQVIHKIDNLITELTKLKPTLSDGAPSNEKKFNDLLTATIAKDDTVADKELDVTHFTNAKFENGIPSWVDPNYGYDPQKPRKPNMRELMEAISGKNLEDLYAENDENWQKISGQTSEMLYGVVGSNEDSRDWLSIMASKDIVKAAQKQTRIMYEPEVDISSKFDENDILIEQIAIIKDKNGKTLRSLSNNIVATEETLRNFGATEESIPKNLEDRIIPEKFDENMLSFLKNFDKKPAKIEQTVLQSASEVIASKISQEIPLDELAKL